MRSALALMAALLGHPLAILSLADAPVRSGIPAGWKVRNVRGQSAPEIEVRNDGEGPLLRIRGAGRAAWFYRELSAELGESAGSLVWSSRVAQFPTGADLRNEKTDDSPLRVFVVFGKPGLLGRSSRVIFYTFGTAEPAEYARAGFGSDRLHVIRFGGTPDLGHWTSNVVQPFADYHRIWRGKAPPITGIGVMQDTDQTGALAVAEMRRLDWIPP